MLDVKKREYLKGYRIQQMRIRRLNELMHEYPEMSAKYGTQLQQCIALCQKMEDEIDAVGDAFLGELLSQKYMCGKSLEEIGLGFNYSKRHMERMHIKALEKFKIS